jgi:thioredoxin-dependent peroxiredoxin
VLIGDKAPDFSLEAENGSQWRLSDHADKVVVLLFYPQNETLVCTRQLCSLRDHWGEYLDTKAEIVGISPGTAEQHSTFAANHRLPIRLLVDRKREITRLYVKHSIFPISFTRAIVVVDASGIVRTRKILLRAFRPSDRSVIASIYRARGDALLDEYGKLLQKTRSLIE